MAAVPPVDHSPQAALKSEKGGLFAALPSPSSGFPELLYSTDPALDDNPEEEGGWGGGNDVTGTKVWDGLRVLWALLAASDGDPDPDVDRHRDEETGSPVGSTVGSKGPPSSLDSDTTSTSSSSSRDLSSSCCSATSTNNTDDLSLLRGLVRGRRVLELGAGTGLLGLGMALSPLGAAEVVITDLPCHLPRLHANIALNMKKRANAANSLTPKTACTVRAVALPWGVSARETAAALAPSPPPKESATTTTTSTTTARVPKTREAACCCKEVKEKEVDVDAAAVFDVVVACEVLHWPALDLWQPDTLPLLAATVRTTVKPGGAFLICFREREAQREKAFFDLLLLDPSPEPLKGPSSPAEVGDGETGRPQQPTGPKAAGDGGTRPPEFRCVLEVRPPLPGFSHEGTDQAGAVVVRLVQRSQGLGK